MGTEFDVDLREVFMIGEGRRRVRLRPLQLQRRR